MKGYYDSVTAMLKQHGFSFVRSGKGSHQLWGNGSLLVTVPKNCESRHTANAIMKSAGINHKF